jgi:ComF family protein
MEPGWAFNGVFVMSPYEQNSLLQTCVKALKYHHAPDLAYTLGVELGKWFKVGDFRDFSLIPVPLHPKRERKRGYNQSRLLCEGVATSISLPIVNGLRRIRNTSPQAQLSREDRLTNLLGSFEVKGEIPPKIVLIDDVCSTGATLNECAKALKKEGAHEVYGLVLGRG